LSVSGKPVFDPSGRFQGYRGVATDVSDTVRADKAKRALQEVRIELADVSRITSLGALTASIAHEINQPIAAVIMNARAGLRWLGVEPPNLDEVREVLERRVEWGSACRSVGQSSRRMKGKSGRRTPRAAARFSSPSLLRIRRSRPLANHSICLAPDKARDDGPHPGLVEFRKVDL